MLGDLKGPYKEALEHYVIWTAEERARFHAELSSSPGYLARDRRMERLLILLFGSLIALFISMITPGPLLQALGLSIGIAAQAALMCGALSCLLWAGYALSLDDAQAMRGRMGLADDL